MGKTSYCIEYEVNVRRLSSALSYLSSPSSSRSDIPAIAITIFASPTTPVAAAALIASIAPVTLIAPATPYRAAARGPLRAIPYSYYICADLRALTTRRAAIKSALLVEEEEKKDKDTITERLAIEAKEEDNKKESLVIPETPIPLPYSIASSLTSRTATRAIALIKVDVLTRSL
ncbi:uncharacterized protein RSE6_07226 [Rhynchosporium secalis]|uniref:Uncharacterized protein n=1 Tax=Rhynchosporium secalis TaxID=38038 RepID=A0A1E1MCA1_RHYSE|nr:uncharacterized protein RSE6_07226 [Rhynchosporium secalis]